MDLKDIDKAYRYYQKAKRVGSDLNKMIKGTSQASIEGELGLIPQRVKKREAKTPEELLDLKFEKPKKVKPGPEQFDLLGRLQKKLM